MKKRLLAVFAVIAVTLALLPVCAAATEIPQIAAPYHLVADAPQVLPAGGFSAVRAYYLVPTAVTQFTSQEYSDLSHEYGIDPAQNSLLLEADLSVDAKDAWTFSEGKWKNGAAAATAGVGTSASVSSALLFSTAEGTDTKAYAAYLVKNADGVQILDTANHTYYVRVRFHFSFVDTAGKKVERYSDWSETASFGKGVKQQATTLPKEIEAPKIAELTAYNPTEQETRLQFSPTLPESVKDAALVYMMNNLRLAPQAEYRVNDGEWKKVDDLDTNFLPCSAVTPVIPEAVDLEKDTLYVRYRFLANDDAGTASDWSNVIHCGKEVPTTAATTAAKDDAKETKDAGGVFSSTRVKILIAVIIVLVILIAVLLIFRKKKEKAPGVNPAASDFVIEREETPEENE